MIYKGIYKTGCGTASTNLRYVHSLICRLTGLRDLLPGTLNVFVGENLIDFDHIIDPVYYMNGESLKLKRCLLSRPECTILLPGVVVRPSGHETHGNSQINLFEIMSNCRIDDKLSLVIGDEVCVRIEIDDEEWNMYIDNLH